MFNNVPSFLSEEKTISRLQRFGLEYKEKVLFKAWSRRFAPAHIGSPHMPPAVEALLFSYNSKAYPHSTDDLFVVRQTPHIDRFFQVLTKVEKYESEPNVYVCEDYRPSSIKVKTKQNLKELKMHIIAEFYNLFGSPKIIINKKYEDYHSVGERRFKFYITNSPELEVFAFQFIQGKMPADIFLDVLQERGII